MSDPVASDPVAILAPEGLPRAVGFSHGALARGPRLYVAGQIGEDEDGNLAAADGAEVGGALAGQFARALDHVMTVVRAGGARPRDIVRMTVYVTDMAGYRRARRSLGAIWRARLGRHYPAMALVGVSELVREGALVEIEAEAAIPEGEGAPARGGEEGGA